MRASRENRADQGLGQNSGGWQSLGEVRQGPGGRGTGDIGEPPEQERGELLGVLLISRDRGAFRGCGKEHASGCREQQRVTGGAWPPPSDTNQWLRHPREGGPTEFPAP